MILRDIISGRRGSRKLSAIILLSAFLPGSLRAQAPPPPPPPDAAQTAPQRLPQEALNELLAPIALYPDALIALILPASTVPSDLVLAARYISSNGDPAQAADQPWDDSVKALVHYPEIVSWMDQNLEWTTQVGEVFLDQPAEVMNAIQQLRVQARAAGNLVDTPQQRIVEEESAIRIIPAEPEVIYVPQYDPEVVYVQPYAPHIGPALSFGVGFAVGSWLRYDCDWHRRKVCVGDWNPGWKHDWRRGDDDVRRVNVVNINKNSAREWQPNAKIQRRHLQRERSTAAVNVNARVRRNNDVAERRLSAVAKPSRQDLSRRNDEVDRRRSPDRGASNEARKWKRTERGNGDDQSNATVKRQSLSVKEKTWQGGNVEARKRQVDYSSARANRASNEDKPPAERAKTLRSRANDSPQEFRKKRAESVQSEGGASQVNKRSVRIERSKVSRDAGVSNSRQNKSKQEAGTGRNRGGKKGDGEGKKKENGDD